MRKIENLEFKVWEMFRKIPQNFQRFSDIIFNLSIIYRKKVIFASKLVWRNIFFLYNIIKTPKKWKLSLKTIIFWSFGAFGTENLEF